MSELDEIVAACGKIWNLWEEEEADKIHTMFRDIGKKQRTDPGMKFLTRIPYRHKELEKRLEELHKFRFQF